MSDKVPTPSISLGDLQAFVKFIDVAIERGACRGNEIHEVAHMRGKIVSVLEHESKKGEQVAKQD